VTTARADDGPVDDGRTAGPSEQTDQPPASIEQPAVGDGGDIWAIREDRRGKEIQKELASTEFAGYFVTDTLPDFVTGKVSKAENFPLIDFISADNTHAVSLKTVNPYSKGYSRGDTIYGLQEHAEELVGFAPGERVTLDIRFPPGTPSSVMTEIADALRDVVDDPDGRLDVRTSHYP
jgi:hypothetical protein